MAELLETLKFVAVIGIGWFVGGLVTEAVARRREKAARDATERVVAKALREVAAGVGSSRHLIDYGRKKYQQGRQQAARDIRAAWPRGEAEQYARIAEGERS